MTVWLLTVTIMSGVLQLRAWPDGHHHATPQFLEHMDEMPQLADVSGAGAQRGPRWYDYDSAGDHNSESDIHKHQSVSGSSGSLIGTESKSSRRSSEGSSLETLEKRVVTRAYRECTPCPLDMIRKHTNVGIKWICAAYQRARRTFKSECMMRFRNCQDGTMFIKISDHRCREDPYHGRHWFYIYRV